MASATDLPSPSVPQPPAAASQEPPSLSIPEAGTKQAHPSAHQSPTAESPVGQKSLKRAAPALDVPALTGATAQAEERYHLEETRRQRARLTSQNPAMTAKNTLMGTADQAMSRVNDRAPTTSSLEQSSPMNTLAHTATVAEPLQIDNTQTSPVSMSESDNSLMRGATATSAGDHPHTPMSNPRREERSNKAMTYPPPPSPGDESANRPRNLSYSGPGSSGSKSGAKKHKCPECDTEFTRHHNLKSHLLTHSREKPYTCPNCNAKFRRLHDLKRHSKLHTGERPHMCPKCGRKFARGDALARHNKGPGGCAGRRESTAGDEDYVEGMDGSMDGVIYQEPASDDHLDDPDRRQSEPSNNRRKSSQQSRSDTGPGAYNRPPSTYPPVAQMSSGPRGSLNAGSGAPQQNPNHLSPAATSQPSFSHVQFNPSSFSSHPGMTESPKPLSPGQPDPHRLNASDGSHPRGRSPSLTTQFQQHHFGRGSGRGTPPIGLPPPGLPQPPQLPSLSGLSSEPRHASQQLSSSSKPSSLPPHPPILQSQPPLHHNSGGSNQSSASSHQQSSGASLRDFMGSSSSHGAIPGSSESQFVEYIRTYEKQLRDEFHRELEHQLQTQRAQYEGELARLRDEIASLRGQHNHSSGPLPNPSSASQHSHTQQ